MSGNPTVVGVSHCRVCGQADLTPFLDLGRQPLANAFLPLAALGQPEPTYPLRVVWCAQCSLAQLGEVVDPRLLFRDYLYHSSGMPASKHFRQYAEAIVKDFIHSPNDLVVEIGSNDGHFLAVVKESGTRVVGVDPAANLARIAHHRGVPTIADFFSRAVAATIVATSGPAQVIVGNNVIAHIHDYRDLLEGLAVLLAPDGVFVLEAPYLGDMVAHLTYDTIYHEHLSYLALRPLQVLFARYGLEIFDVQWYPVQGMSFRVFVNRPGVRPIKASVGAGVRRELALGLAREASYHRLAQRIAASKEQLRAVLTRLKKKDGKTIAAYGAPAKGNTLLNYCGIGREFVDFAHEDLPAKVGLYTPGMQIPVVGRAYSERHPPDYFLVLAWNYLTPILAKEEPFRRRGGRFIIPVGDEIRII